MFFQTKLRFDLLLFLLLLVGQISVCLAQTGIIYLVQGGDTIIPKNGLFEVERAYFEIRTTLGEKDELLMNLSPDTMNMHEALSNTNPQEWDWIRNGSGMWQDPNNRPNWLLVKSSDYMGWSAESNYPNGKYATDSITEHGSVLTRLITSFAFYNEGGLDGEYSVFFVPVCRLYLTYTVATEAASGETLFSPPRVIPIRLMGN